MFFFVIKIIDNKKQTKEFIKYFIFRISVEKTEIYVI